MKSMKPRQWSDPELIAANREFCDTLWADARLIGPESFNTCPLVCSLVSQSGIGVDTGPNSCSRNLPGMAFR
jgi:hypothetical protein